jgi:hypothetical protein
VRSFNKKKYFRHQNSLAYCKPRRSVKASLGMKKTKGQYQFSGTCEAFQRCPSGKRSCSSGSASHCSGAGTWWKDYQTFFLCRLQW